MSISPQRPESLVGQVIAGYELTTYIGTGAAGLVYRAKRTATGPQIEERTGFVPPDYPDEAAIKLLVPPMGATQDEVTDFQQRFLREARTLKQLDHPGILSVIDYGEDADAGFFYMILPFMAGGSLAHTIATRGPMPLHDVDAILTTIAGALDYAHSRGIIHRDVKPGNILLDTDGSAKLGDFGIVRLITDSATLRTTTGRLMGTPAYMAPEQFDDSSRVGPAADQYGLGMVAYEMVTGRAAFGATSWAQVMKAQLQDPPESPRALRPDLTEPAEAAILRALAKDPERRFPTVAAFATAFDLGLQGRWDPALIGAADATALAAPKYYPFPQGHATEPTGRTARQRSRAPRLPVVALALLLIIGSLVGLAATGVGSSLLGMRGARATATSGNGAPASSTAIRTTGPAASATVGAHATTTAQSGGGGGGSVTPSIAPAPPTVTPTPLPTFVVSADGLQSTDGVAHGPGNPYVFTSSGPYGNVDIQAGAYVTAVSSCGKSGSGTVQFTANGTVTIAGTITVDAEGYCGGQAPIPSGSFLGYQGSSYAGSSQETSTANYGGGGGGDSADAGGAGGSYGTLGQAGQGGSDPPGNVYGDPTLTTLYLGSGGGSSGRQSGAYGGAGGNGGGAISIVAQSIVITGSGVLTANGGNGQSIQQGNSPNNYRGGGGGSGGSILLSAHTFSISGTVVAQGGQGGYGTHDGTTPAGGGNGGNGRIRYMHT